MAVGAYFATGSNEGLIETRSEGMWTPTEAALPTDASANPQVSLFAVTCPAAGACVAVGNYTDTSGNIEGLVETLSGGQWTGTVAPLPADGDVMGRQADVSDVSCPAVRFCVALGDYDAGPNQQGFVETLSGGMWTATEAPLPSNAALSGNSGTPLSSLNAVTCRAAGSCVVMGQYIDTADVLEGVIETMSKPRTARQCLCRDVADSPVSKT